MSTMIPTSVVVDEARTRARMALEHVAMTAAALRANRIDWVTANSLLWEQRSMLMHTLSSLSAVLIHGDMAGHATIELILADTENAIEALSRALSKNCLLNGPSQRAA